MDLIRRLKRVTLSMYDLEAAEAFAEEVLSDQETNRSELVSAALDLALRISYCRPFTRNRTGKNNDFDSRLTSDCTSSYSAEEQALHEEVYNSRNQIYAHSDPEPYELDVGVTGEGGAVYGHSHNPVRLLSLRKVEQLHAMSRKLRQCLMHERHHIAEQLGPGEY